MTKSEAARLATMDAQRLIGRERTITVDGKWGNFTQTAYQAVSHDLRARVDEQLKMAGTSAVELRAARAGEKAAGVVALNKASSVDEALAGAAKESGVALPLLRAMAAIESNFDPSARNGSSKGLLAMQAPAWADAQKIRPDLPNYAVGVFDQVSNARAGAAYLQANIRSLIAQGYTGEINASVLYIAHQQGAAGFIELWRAAMGLPPGKKEYVTAEKMLKNPPQDGRGPTSDKATFLKRWYAVVQKKLAQYS